jgi:putative nucleotidyltransferase with HDIG domain
MFFNYKFWLAPIIASLILIIVAQYDFLTFHVLAEFFAIFISFMMFTIAWTTVKFNQNYLLLFLASGYFWIGSLDLVHTMAYPDMNLIINGSVNVSSQFWIVTRLMESSLLLAGALVVTKRKHAIIIFVIYSILTVLFTTLIISGYFPDTFVEGGGLTPFKIQSEYLIIVILGIALYRYATKVKFESESKRRLIVAALMISIVTEFVFTAYLNYNDFCIIIGHLLKIFSYWMIYQALVFNNLISPHRLYSTLHKAILQSPLSMGVFKLNGGVIVANSAYNSIMSNDSFLLIKDGERRCVTDFKSWLDVYGVKNILKKLNAWHAKIEVVVNNKKYFYNVIISPVVGYDEKATAGLVVISDMTDITYASNIMSDKNNAITDILIGSISAVAELLETRDPYTAGHSIKVSEIAVEIGKELSLNAHELEGIRIAGLIHDIGKIKVPMEILNKPGRLSKAEFEIIKEHPIIGYSVIKHIPFPWNVPKIVRSHHERWQGQGYPDGLVGDEIPFGARILAVADVIDSVTAHRPYREALGFDKALEILTQGRDVEFDPVIVDAALKISSHLRTMVAK